MYGTSLLLLEIIMLEAFSYWVSGETWKAQGSLENSVSKELEQGVRFSSHMRAPGCFAEFKIQINSLNYKQELGTK